MTFLVLCSAGDVVLKETYDKCIKPDGVWKGKTLHKGDVIELEVCKSTFCVHPARLCSISPWHISCLSYTGAIPCQRTRARDREV